MVPRDAARARSLRACVSRGADASAGGVVHEQEVLACAEGAGARGRAQLSAGDAAVDGEQTKGGVLDKQAASSAELLDVSEAPPLIGNLLASLIARGKIWEVSCEPSNREADGVPNVASSEAVSTRGSTNTGAWHSGSVCEEAPRWPPCVCPRRLCTARSASSP